MTTPLTRTLFATVLCIGATTISPSYASIIHDEGVDGDLSGDRFNPTPHTLVFGTNSLLATSGPASDREYVMLSIPGGLQLDSIVLVSYESLDEVAFIAVQSGTQMTEPPSGTDPNNLLGWTHFGPGAGNVGTDILDDLGAAVPSIGFTPPLGPGDYTYWIQQTGAFTATYQFDFNVSPEPMTLALLTVSALALRRRRR